MCKALPILILITFFRFHYSPSVYSQTNIEGYKLIRTFKKDTTGSNLDDYVIISADVENNGYIVEIEQHNGKKYMLKPASDYKYLAPYTTFWDINIQILDINNDNVPEIITWGQMTHENAIHIFRWDGTDYRIVYSGFHTEFNFKDITGDRILELIIVDRLYGTGYESTYYQWQKNQYSNIHYKLSANKGFDKIQGLFDYYNSLHADELSYSNHYFESLLNNFFTQECMKNKDNITYVKEFGKDLFSIQITKYLDETIEFNTTTGEAIKDTWKFKVLAYQIENTKIIPKEMILTVITKRVDNQDFKIDSIFFNDFNIKDSFYQSVY